MYQRRPHNAMLHQSLLYNKRHNTQLQNKSQKNWAAGRRTYYTQNHFEMIANAFKCGGVEVDAVTVATDAATAAAAVVAFQQ